MASEISVVICAYTEKRWDELLAAIASVRRQTVPPKDIIVVIDYNPDLLQRVGAEITDVTIVENQGDKGLSGARNTGWKTARGEIVAFLDDDALAAANWLEYLLADYADSRVVGVGGKLNPLWQTHRPAWFPAEFNWVIGCSYPGLPERSARIRNMIGANMS